MEFVSKNTVSLTKVHLLKITLYLMKTKCDKFVWIDFLWASVTFQKKSLQTVLDSRQQWRDVTSVCFMSTKLELFHKHWLQIRSNWRFSDRRPNSFSSWPSEVETHLLWILEKIRFLSNWKQWLTMQLSLLLSWSHSS